MYQIIQNMCKFDEIYKRIDSLHTVVIQFLCWYYSNSFFVSITSITTQLCAFLSIDNISFQFYPEPYLDIEVESMMKTKILLFLRICLQSQICVPSKKSNTALKNIFWVRCQNWAVAFSAYTTAIKILTLTIIFSSLANLALTFYLD